VGVVPERGTLTEEISDGEQQFFVFAEADESGGKDGASDLVKGAEAISVDGQVGKVMGVRMVEGEVDGTKLSSIDGVGLCRPGGVHQVHFMGRRVGRVEKHKGCSEGGGSFMGEAAAICIAVQPLWAAGGMGGWEGGVGGGVGGS